MRNDSKGDSTCSEEEYSDGLRIRIGTSIMKRIAQRITILSERSAKDAPMIELFILAWATTTTLVILAPVTTLRVFAHLVTGRISSGGGDQRGAPPHCADLLLFVFLSKESREQIIGDLEQDFPKHVKRYGRAWARWYYFIDVLWALKPAFHAFVAKIIKFLASTGALAWLMKNLPSALAWLGDFIRRIN